MSILAQYKGGTILDDRSTLLAYDQSDFTEVVLSLVNALTEPQRNVWD